MPSAPPRVCARCGGHAVRGQPCACRPAFEGSTHPGGSRRWQRVRAAKLRTHPICQRPNCHRLAVEVDHIIPLAEGGSQFDQRNLQSLCRPHHQEKTAADALRGRNRPR